MKSIVKFHLIIIAFICTVSEAFSQPIFIGINCGSDEQYLSPTGDLFQTDEHYSSVIGFGHIGGFASSSTTFLLVGGTEGLTPLYQECREGTFDYLFDVDPGLYILTLYFNEITYHGKYFRSFSMFVEDTLLIEDFDIFEYVGREYALIKIFLIECNDGQINVEFVPGSISGTVGGTLSAISIRSAEPDTIAPEPVQNFNIIGGYDMNILYWAGNQESDFKGFIVYRRESNEPWQVISSDNHTLSRFIDQDAIPNITFEYKLAVEDIWGNVSEFSDSLSASALPLESSELPIYEIEVSEGN